MDVPFQWKKLKEEADFQSAVERGLACAPDEVKELVNAATDLDGNEPRDMVCLICKNTVYDPVKCKRTECEELFCNLCINQWLEENNQCPNCKQERSFEPIGRKMRSMLAQNLVVCRCKKIMTYEKLIGEHKSVCLKKKVSCPLGCGHVISPAHNAMIHYQ